jgi:hypothetical protein
MQQRDKGYGVLIVLYDIVIIRNKKLFLFNIIFL